MPFASGSGYALSADLIQYLVSNIPLLKRYYNEVTQIQYSYPNIQDVSIGTWLFPLDVKHFDDRRFNIGWKCDNDAITIHAVKQRETMEQLFSNSNDFTKCICEQIKRGDVK